MAVPNVTETVSRAKAAPCPACEIVEILRQAAAVGAWTKAGTLRKSKAVRAAFVHTCEKMANGGK